MVVWGVAEDGRGVDGEVVDGSRGEIDGGKFLQFNLLLELGSYRAQGR
jgi:hypothetical protein